MQLRTASALATIALVLAGCSSTPSEDAGGQDAASPGAAGQTPLRESVSPTPTTRAPSSSTPSASAAKPGPPRMVGTIAGGLEVPWGIAFLPNGTALVTERDSTRLLHLRPRSGDEVDWRVREVATIAEASPMGEGGLLGVAISPDFAADRFVYLYLTTAEDNRVLRYRFNQGALSDPTPILTGIPNGFTHDGGQLAFGPDGYLYISTGEAGQPELAADPQSLGGKILRVTPDGEPAPDNPDPSSPIWTLGHRNVQGLAWSEDGAMYASEFGDSDFDEVNLIEPGNNYGWPVIEGEGVSIDGTPYAAPQVVWPTDDASPSGLAATPGHLWLGALRGQRLWRLDVDANGATNPRAYFLGAHGRLRSVATTPDGMLWVTTSNRDGRGDPDPDDDQILLIAP